MANSKFRVPRCREGCDFFIRQLAIVKGHNFCTHPDALKKPENQCLIEDNKRVYMKCWESHKSPNWCPRRDTEYIPLVAK